MKNNIDQIKDILNYLDDHDLYPDLRLICSGADPEVIIDGKKVLMFSSNNYLGLATNQFLVDAAIEAIRQFGVGSDGSRLLSGNLSIHRKLEEKIAEFKGGEDAIVWPTGYSANVGTISALTNYPNLKAGILQDKNIIISDELNHASIIDGCKMSKQKIFIYKHKDTRDLERILKKFRKKRKLVITDGVFSMDGDIAPLDKISILCKKYNALLMIDEAHATGMLGKNGEGTPEYFGLKPVRDIDIVMGTFSKALASTGGFVVGSKELIRYLKIASRSYIFSTAMTPATSASSIAALDLISRDPSIRENMWNNVEYMRKGFQDIGFNTLDSSTQIIPILIGSDEMAIKFSRLLFDRGIFGPCVRWPAVNKGMARIRFTVMSTHKKEHIDYLIKSCFEIGKELGILK